jgi:hypothetical protein
VGSGFIGTRAGSYFSELGFGTSEVRNPSGFAVPSNPEPEQDFGFPVPRNPESITNFREKIIKVCVNFQSSQKYRYKWI